MLSRYFLLALCLLDFSDSKVLELSDRFLPLRKEGMWLIMFYAPWCGHCKKLEPIWKHVGQSLAHEPLRIGRIDCTRFTSVAAELGIKGFPTVLFFKGDNVFSYEGDRTREEIVAFARRLLGPPVKDINGIEDLEGAKAKSDTFFVYVGEPEGTVWEQYQYVSAAYQQHEFFYHASARTAEGFITSGDPSGIWVFKDENHFKYEQSSSVHGFADSPDGDDERSARSLASPPTEGLPPAEPTPPTSLANDSLYTWVAQERFPEFVKVTHSKFQHLLSTNKLVVIVVLEENRIGEMTPEMEEFRDMVKTVLDRNRQRYHSYFQFGWTGTPELANSVAMETLSLPNLLVVNSSTYQHHIPDDDPLQLTAEAVQLFLDDILQGTAPVYGGSSFTVRLYRSYYQARSSLSEMWQGNPALTAVLFGLPLGFFALICYSICCADIMDAEEEEEEQDEWHEKTD